jgi:hypothetical protein
MPECLFVLEKAAQNGGVNLPFRDPQILGCLLLRYQLLFRLLQGHQPVPFTLRPQ